MLGQIRKVSKRKTRQNLLLFGVDQKNFAQQMTGILATFEKAREWADLSNSLQKLKRAID